MNKIKRTIIIPILVFLALEVSLFAVTMVNYKEGTPFISPEEKPLFLFSSKSAAAGKDKQPDVLFDPPEPFSEEEMSYLILVNKENPVDENYKPPDLKPIKYYSETRSPEGRFMRAEAAEQFHKMVNAAKEEGYTIKMTTAYRSYGFQKILWNNYVANDGEEDASTYSAKPGQSEHQTGLAVDLTSPTVKDKLTVKFGETEEGQWLEKNAHNFGFILRYPKGGEEETGYRYEPWHFRYVGKRAAAEIYKRGMTLEAFHKAYLSEGSENKEGEEDEEEDENAGNADG